MSKNKSNIDVTGGVRSDIVGSIVQANESVNSEIGVAVSKIAIRPTIKVDKKKDKRVVIVGTLLIIIIIVGLILFFLLGSNKSKENKNESRKAIYEQAYETLNFSENDDLKKLYCTKNNDDNSQVREEETLIYYFEGDEVHTSIYHNNIILSEDYMEYYDVMYDEYQKSLNTDYEYDNVDTTITKGENELLITVITYNKKEAEKKLGIQPFVNYDDAKKVTIDSGYSCK